MRARLIFGTWLLIVGCGGETLDVGGSAFATPEYAGPLPPPGDGNTLLGPTPVATHQWGAMAVAVDDRRVYWATTGGSVNIGGGVVRSCAKADCAATVVTYALEQSAELIAVSATHVYWTTGDRWLAADIVACPIEGCLGAPSVIASQVTVGGLLVDEHAVYFTSERDSTLLRCPVDGCRGAPTVLTLTDGANWLAADQSDLFWGDEAAIRTLPKDGSGPVQTISARAHWPGGIAVHGDHVYWANDSDSSAGGIRSCPIAGCDGEPATLAVEQSYPLGLAVDGTNVYWFTGGGGPLTLGNILQCPLSGCGSNPTVLAADQPSPTSLAIDSSFVYWTNRGESIYAQGYDGSVNRVPIATP